jgi:hypothetical protein
VRLVGRGPEPEGNQIAGCWDDGRVGSAPVDKYHLIFFEANFDGTPLSYFGPTMGDDLGVSEELWSELEAWSIVCERFEDVDSSTGWKSGFDAAGYERDGDELAMRIALTLGLDWAFERRHFNGFRRARSQPYWIRSEQPAKDPSALVRAETLARGRRESDERFVAARARGAKFDIVQQNNPRSGS